MKEHATSNKQTKFHDFMYNTFHYPVYEVFKKNGKREIEKNTKNDLKQQ